MTIYIAIKQSSSYSPYGNMERDDDKVKIIRIFIDRKNAIAFALRHTNVTIHTHTLKKRIINKLYEDLKCK